jgi:acetate kinase
MYWKRGGGMNVLSISPTLRKIEYALFETQKTDAITRGEIRNWMGRCDSEKILEKINADIRPWRPDRGINRISVRIPFGGDRFTTNPVRACESVFAELEKMKYDAPLHLPNIVELCRNIHRGFSEIPMNLVFETSFFTALPEREASYAIPNEKKGGGRFRRTGYHGLFHQAASRKAFSHEHPGNLDKVISICLEPTPEIVAIYGGNPILVTSGATPLEGLPGQTTCGELDPFIVLMLAKKLHWGPEQINECLTQKSGMLGLNGKRIRLDDALSNTSPENRLAGRMLRYRILQSCGAAVAAMGGADMIVFSGRYARAGRKITPYLSRHLHLKTKIRFRTEEKPMLRIIAEVGMERCRNVGLANSV